MNLITLLIGLVLMVYNGKELYDEYDGFIIEIKEKNIPLLSLRFFGELWTNVTLRALFMFVIGFILFAWSIVQIF
jgi:hypothetical protein